MPKDPFRPLNLRRNPFGEVPREQRAELAVVDLEPWLSRVRAGKVVEFVGDSGRGKSTRLRAMDARLREATYVHVHEQGPPPELPEGPVLLVDELQFLPARRRRRLAGRDAGIAVGTHVSLADEFEAAGRDIRTVELGGADVDAVFVGQVVERRLEWARRDDDGPVPGVSEAAVDWLLDAYGSNVRAMEHHLYEVYQALDAIRAVEPGDLEAARRPPESVVETRGDYTPKS